MAEYFAKNLGIRHCRGRFVLVTNPDAVFSPHLITFLAGRTLRDTSFYTAGMRFDAQWPSRPTDPAKYLKKMMKRVRDDSKLMGTDYEKTLHHRPESHKPAVEAFGHICEGGDDGQGFIQGYWDFHAGDFVIAAKHSWEAIGGYPEVEWTFGVDSSALCKLFGRGLRNAALLPPCIVVHQHHRVRENPNARKVMDPDQICEMSKKNPLQRFHPKQRSPEKWGIFKAKYITEVTIVRGGKPKEAYDLDPGF